jgi:hypothetical protein
VFKANLRFFYHPIDIVRSNFHHADQLAVTAGRVEGIGGGCVMRDWISDWKKWSPAERCFAILLVIIALAVPLGLLIEGGRIGS